MAEPIVGVMSDDPGALTKLRAGTSHESEEKVAPMLLLDEVAQGIEEARAPVDVNGEEVDLEMMKNGFNVATFRTVRPLFPFSSQVKLWADEMWWPAAFADGENCCYKTNDSGSDTLRRTGRQLGLDCFVERWKVSLLAASLAQSSLWSRWRRLLSLLGGLEKARAGNIYTCDVRVGSSRRRSQVRYWLSRFVAVVSNGLFQLAVVFCSARVYRV
jgi:hypothetical protein